MSAEAPQVRMYLDRLGLERVAFETITQRFAALGFGLELPPELRVSLELRDEPDAAPLAVVHLTGRAQDTGEQLRVGRVISWREAIQERGGL